MIGSLDVLSRKAGFNTALRHFRATTSFLKPIESGTNLADLLGEALENGTITRGQLRPIVSALLPDKYGYYTQSGNVKETIETPEQIVEALSAWTALQIVIAYEHPQAGLFIINPVNPESWESALPVLKDELVVVYVSPVPGADVSAASLKKAVEDVHGVLAGEKPRGRKEYVLPEGHIRTGSPQTCAKTTPENDSRRDPVDGKTAHYAAILRCCHQ